MGNVKASARMAVTSGTDFASKQLTAVPPSSAATCDLSVRTYFGKPIVAYQLPFRRMPSVPEFCNDQLPFRKRVNACAQCGCGC
jgi:hypothetical protein